MKPNVLIIGAKSDIARAIAARYAASGCELTLAGRGRDELQKIATDLEIRYKITATILELDITRYDTHSKLINELNPCPEIVVCAAGYLGNQPKAETDSEEARRIMDTNYTGCASVLSVVANRLEEQGRGTIIGIGSVAGDRGRMSNYFYGSAKAGFEAFLSGLRSRLAKKEIHVLTVKPGFVKTQMTREMQLPPLLTATPEQVARDVVNAARKKKNVIYTKWFWRYIMLIIKMIPEFIFKKTKL